LRNNIIERNSRFSILAEQSSPLARIPSIKEREESGNVLSELFRTEG
jgi:hypothetical protein